MRILAALAHLRWRLWRNGLRSISGISNAIAAIAITALGSLLVAGVSVLFGGVCFAATRHGNLDDVRLVATIAFWSLAVMAVLVPLLAGSREDPVPLRRLLHFPIGRRHVAWFALASTMLSAWSLLSVVPLAAIALGLAFGGASPVVAASISVLLWATYTALGLAARQVSQLVLRRRGTRELVAIVGTTVFVAASLIPGIVDTLDPQGLESGRLLGFELREIGAVIAAAAEPLPPALAVHGVSEMLEPRVPVASLLGLAAWALLGVASAIVAVGRGLERESGDSRTGSVSRRHGGRSLCDRMLTPQLAAAGGLQLRYLFRSVAGRLTLVVAPMFGVMIGLLARHSSATLLGFDRATLTLYCVVAYAVLLGVNVGFNAFGWEGGGVRGWFLAPVPARTVVLGKSLGLLAFDALVAVATIGSFCLAAGPPPLTALLGAALAWLAVVMVRTAVALPCSIVFPVRRDPTEITSSPAQTSTLIALVMVPTTTSVVFAIAVLASWVGGQWLAPLMTAACAAVGIGVWWWALGPIGDLLERRREELIQSLSGRPT